jgi:hypothetical protein
MEPLGNLSRAAVGRPIALDAAARKCLARLDDQ